MPPLRGHEGCVESVAFSPDSAMIVSGTEDATIRVWHAGSGKEFLQMRGHEAGILSMVFSVDGRRIVSGSWDSTVRVWDVTTGAQVFPEFRGHTTWVTSVFFSPNTDRIVSQSRYESLSWDAAIGGRTYSTEASDHCLSGAMYITHDGRIVDSSTGRTLGKLPTVVANSSYVVHGRSLAMRMNSGRVPVLRFPPALLTRPENKYHLNTIHPKFQNIGYPREGFLQSTFISLNSIY
jgi:WD40 repeat protein